MLEHERILFDGLIARLKEKEHELTSNVHDFLSYCVSKVEKDVPLTVQEWFSLGVHYGRVHPKVDK